MLTLSTPYQIEKTEKFEDFDDFLSEIDDRKERKKVENINSKQMCVSSQKIRMRKEEGATVAASHLPSPWGNSAGWSREGRTGRDSPRRFHRKAP